MLSTSDISSFVYQAPSFFDGHLPKMSANVSSRPIKPKLSNIALLDELVTGLQMAIKYGDVNTAGELSIKLAELRPMLNAKLETDSTTTEQDFNLKVYICDKESTVDDNSIFLRIKPFMTVETLKNMVFHKYGYVPEYQKWIVGRRLGLDSDTLGELGVNFDGAVVFLYLLSPKNSNISGPPPA